MIWRNTVKQEVKKAEEAWSRAWYSARETYGALLRGDQPAVVATDLLLQPGELCFQYTKLNYAWLHGLGSIPISQWQGHGEIATAVTNHRILYFLDGEWQSFWHGHIAQFQLELPERWFVLHFHTGYPVRLSGVEALTCALVVTYNRYGPTVMQEPLFALLAQ